MPFTWLYGSAGSGKTILSAGIVKELQGFCAADPAKSLAFFFFDFDDAKKRDPVNMVKSLLSQFLNRCSSVPDTVRSVYTACGDGQCEASLEQLLQALRDTLELMPASFVVLDALDECRSWSTLLEIVEEMQKWDKNTLRVILTSRQEVTIQEGLEDIIPSDSWTCLESRCVDKDIRTYVKERLAKDKSFKRWQRDPDIREEIERTLGREAHGMYSLSGPHSIS